MANAPLPLWSCKIIWVGILSGGEAEGYGSHYWNRIEGKEIDYTRDQFPVGTKIFGGKKANRKRMLSYASVRKRYKALGDRVKSS